MILIATIRSIQGVFDFPFLVFFFGVVRLTGFRLVAIYRRVLNRNKKGFLKEKALQ